MKIPAKYRKTIYAGTAVALATMILLGVVTPEQVSAATENAVQIVAAFSAVLALLNVTED